MNAPREQSEFDSSFSYLNRLNLEFYICAEAKFYNNINQWYNSLLVLFTELSTEMQPDEIEYNLRKIKELKIRVNQYGLKLERSGKNQLPSDLYWSLLELELAIRKVMRESGLQLKLKMDPGSALG